jgi:Asp/Glu/hydantoin racemase
MVEKTIGLIHTSATLVPVFAELAGKYLEGHKIFNIVDDSLIKNTIACGELTPDTSKRVVTYAACAQDAGADIIMYTCSSIGPAVEKAASLCHVPVWRVDQPMADKAIELGSRIGVIATLSTTLAPTADLVTRRAQIAGKEIMLNAHLCDGAFDALMQGNATLHDTMVANALNELAVHCDVILLAQASMARVLLQPETSKISIPVLASPELAIQALAKYLNGE